MSDSALCATMKALDCRMCMHRIYTDAHTCSYKMADLQHSELENRGRGM